MYLDGQGLVRRGGVDDAAASNCAATSASAEAAMECVRAISEARGLRAMKPIAGADSRRFMVSPDGCLLSELSSRHVLEREKFDIESRSATLY